MITKKYGVKHLYDEHDVGMKVPPAVLCSTIYPPTVGNVISSVEELHFLDALVMAVRDVASDMGGRMIVCPELLPTVVRYNLKDGVIATYSSSIDKGGGSDGGDTLVESFIVDISPRLLGKSAVPVIACDGTSNRVLGFDNVFHLQMIDGDLYHAALHTFVPAEGWIEGISELSNLGESWELADAADEAELPISVSHRDREPDDALCLRVVVPTDTNDASVVSLIAILAGSIDPFAIEQICCLIRESNEVLLKFGSDSTLLAAASILEYLGAKVEHRASENSHPTH